MNSKLMRITVTLISVFAVIYFGYQIYQFVYTPYRTEIAELYHYTNEVNLEGIAVKEEQVIDQTYSGVIKYEYNNSQKVKAGATIATVYPSELDLVNGETAEHLKSRIALLEELEQQDGNGFGDVQNIHEMIKKKQTQILYNVRQNDYSMLDEDTDAFLSLLSKQEKALNPQVSYSEEINRLKEEFASMTLGQGTAITTPISGYFTGRVDGYETVLTSSILENLSVDSLTELLEHTEAQPIDHAVGKMITSTEWKFAALVKTKDLENFSEGKRATLIFNENSSYQVAAKVEKIDKNPDGKTSIILFSSNIMNGQIIDLRKEKAAAYFGSGRGLRVSRKAVRMVDGQVGVYINSGRVARFKKLDIQYSAEDYVISRLDDDKDYLQLYDEIIIEGKDELYDNKPL